MVFLRQFHWKVPGPWQWVLLSGVAVVCLLLSALGGWAWWRSYQSRGLAELGLVTVRLQGVQGAVVSAAMRAEAIKALQSLIERYPRLTALPQAAYQFGNLHYQAKAFAEARQSYQLALDKGARGSLATLCRLGIGYTWEAQGDHAKALAVFEGALQKLTPKDFLYEELLTNVARSHELLGHPDRVREVYHRLLKDFPQSRRAEDIRVHLASLEGSARR